MGACSRGQLIRRGLLKFFIVFDDISFEILISIKEF